MVVVRSAAALAILLQCSVAHRMLQQEDDGPIGVSVREVLVFELTVARKGCEGVHLSHQNRTLNISRASCSRRFSGADLHKEYVVQSEGHSANAVYLKTSGMCGVGLFTKDELDCSAVASTELQPFLKLLPEQPAVRGFGVELELVAHSKMSHSVLAEQMSRISNQMAASPNAQFAAQTLLPFVKRCFGMKVNPSKEPKCDKHENCSLNGYCRQAHSTTWKSHKEAYCKKRKRCHPSKSVDGHCPVSTSSWTWTSDPSVKPLTLVQMLEAGEVSNHAGGIPFELISPVLSGMRGLRSTVEVMVALRELGIQAGPSSGMHVHVNAGKPWNGDAKASMGSHLSAKQILNVWAHYARFQLVINEMLQDSRIGNSYAYPLLFTTHSTVTRNRGGRGNLSFAESQYKFSQAAQAVRQIYANLQAYVQAEGGRDPLGKPVLRNQSFCDAALQDVYRGTQNPCSRRYPRARYFQVNLAPLNRLGTLEFRGFPATNDPERALRWILFVLRFVEHFKDDSRFVGKDAEVLEFAQLEASHEDLETELNTDLAFFRERSWITGPACEQEPKDDAEEQQDESDAEALQEAWEEENNEFLPVVIEGDYDNDEDDGLQDDSEGNAADWGEVKKHPA
eukprot:TRINITY_DN9115_c1_g1_i1.p1 TRINITY_DN9115_c1_g1~~TRINITY_DN9115_c1_g1_i1.p1  ORF type:complete len:652 (-),score=103.99 TRINITY_DN9115_c1_g1_i1:74-1939(-)